MIVSMQKLRIMGPRNRLHEVLAQLQDLGVVHLCRPRLVAPLVASRVDPKQERRVAYVQTAIDDVEEALSRLGDPSEPDGMKDREGGGELPRCVRLARRARRATAALVTRLEVLEEEGERLAHLRRVLGAFEELAIPGVETRSFYLVLADGVADAESQLRDALEPSIGAAFSLHVRPLAAGEQAAVLLVPRAEAERIEGLLPELGVRELDVPRSYRATSADAGVRRLAVRLREIEAERLDLAGRRAELAAEWRPVLYRVRRTLHDWLLTCEALGTTAATPHAFVIEGWLPVPEREVLESALAAGEGGALAIEEVERETWSAKDIPVAIENPPLFRPFEVITRRLPMPHYGTMDPTPFVAIFFPMFFGLILGDLAYGALLLTIAAIVWARSREGSTARSVAQIGVACGAFAMAFGICFGELLGDLGHRWLGLRALAFSRDQAIVPFLVLVLAIGFVHIVLGLVLGACSGLRTNPRRSLGRGLSAVMLVLALLLVLAAVNVLPAAFFTPTAVGLLVAFPILLAIEGMSGAVELISRFSNILSYARIMALGTASVMLAAVANQLAGAFGSLAVGILFGALFHLVNFALGVFSPTIHALRLHFVEFFGTFYSPGGLVYCPFRHWRAVDAVAPSSA
jgi:V/A-type H+-transporting ATPase subunit I